MTELLSKEKEFLKLNEQLNMMASSALEQHASQAISVAASDVAGTMSFSSGRTSTDTRFLTYQKSKGQSTLLRKNGAGDGALDVVDLFNQATAPIAKERLNLTLPYRQGNNPYSSRFSTSPRITVTAPTPTPPPTTGQPANSGKITPTVAPSPISKTSTITRHRPPNKGNETYRAPNQSRFNGSRIPPTNTSTFTVKYRNAKFVKSPSLELLHKEECSTLRSQQSCTDSNSHLESSASSVINEDVQSTGRRSQASILTIGSKKNVSTDGLIKFLKSKVTILEEDHTRISQEMAKQKELLDKALDQVKAMEQQRDQAYAKHNALKDQLTKVESQLEDAGQCNKDRSKEQLKQQKELETAKREIKILTQNNKNLEKRLYKANEELENSRTTITQFKKSERDLKEQSRVELEAKEKQIKNLRKQRMDLLNAYKKQLYLIDNLKRQTICMEQAKMIEFGEKEFSKVLGWDIKS
uniref:Testis-expressed sequence 9 protein n=1 Tax=Stomoxys calcitrans TaxID=35570 RepID=A0A1I8PXI7_STOCA